MDKEIAKEILSAYRANGMDADDETFTEALQLCRRDPEMSQWLDAALQFDRKCIEAMRSIESPESGKKAVLATAQFDRPERGRSSLFNIRNWWSLGAVAALVAIALLVLPPSEIPLDTIAESQDHSWFALAGRLAESPPPLELRDAEFANLRNWLAREGAPAPASIPAALGESAEALGCRSFDLGNGKMASLICFELEGSVVHVFTVDRANLNNPPTTELQWTTENGWNLYAWSEGEKTITIASQLPPEAFAKGQQTI